MGAALISTRVKVMKIYYYHSVLFHLIKFFGEVLFLSIILSLGYTGIVKLLVRVYNKPD